MVETCVLGAGQREAHEDLDKNCTILQCPRKAVTRQMCSKHYQRYLRYVVADLAPDENETKKCDHPQCDEPLYARHLCESHYQLFRKYVLKAKKKRRPKEPGERCGVPDCNALSYANRLCDLHYQRVRRTGTPYLPTLEQKRQLRELNRLYTFDPKTFDFKKVTGEIDIDEIPEHIIIYNRNVHCIDLTVDATQGLIYRPRREAGR